VCEFECLSAQGTVCVSKGLVAPTVLDWVDDKLFCILVYCICLHKALS
jgi:hypothetical protein